MAITVNDRIDVRISKEQKELIKYASELSGFKSLSEFIVYHVQAQAQKIIKDSNTILSSMEDKRIFLEAILNPAEPNDALKKARLNYNKFKEANGEENSTVTKTP
ncbi:type II toxin-antitoxin system TacA family antitoxin [Pedobacter sp. GR22-6]|uniref:type II toxin-antitoxin system TacA family antitoxin n=1 Tax=Pedobacter sp. GR22-6 TaxID=3127957 RepID=UPI00307E5765